MIIGNFKKVGGDYLGTIKTLQFTIGAAIVPVSDKQSDKSPDFSVLNLDRDCEIGAAWKKTSQDGLEYLSVSIEDPTVSIKCALFKTVEPGYVLTWSRNRN